MAKTTATGRNIANVNAFIRDVANVYGKGSQQYEDAINSIADFDIYENKNGILQISNNKENRRQHQQIRALRHRAKRTRAGQRWKKALSASKSQRAAFRQYHQLKKDFNEIMTDIYKIIDEFERLTGMTIDVEKWNMLSNPDVYAYYKERVEDMKREREYLNKQYAETTGVDIGDDFTNPDFF